MDIYFRPGTHYAYSGEGIQLLQLVVEKRLRSVKLEDMAQQKRYSNPFGMTKSSFIWQPRFESDYANGHGIAEDTFKKDKYKQAYREQDRWKLLLPITPVL